MKLDKRVKRNTASIIALRDFLVKVKDSPGNFADNAELLNALKTQGNLSKFIYKDFEFEIHSSSLGTVKRIADRVLEGGFTALDNLRNAVAEKLKTYNKQNKRNPSNKVTKEGLKKRVEELQDILQTSDEHSLLLTKLLEQSLRQGRNYALDSGVPIIIARCEKEQGELRDMMTLRKRKPTAAGATNKDDDQN